MKEKFTSEKLYDGYSCCFRQWKAEGTHCKYLHGYAISFKVTYEGELDDRNWVFDFGGMKRSQTLVKGMHPIEYFNYMFDHTTIIAEDDPHLSFFQGLDKLNVIKLRTMDNVGCERFAQFIYNIINDVLKEETNGRVKATKVTVYENNKNSATYKI